MERSEDVLPGAAVVPGRFGDVRVVKYEPERAFTWDRSVFPSSHWYPDVSGDAHRRVWQRVEFAMASLVPASSFPLRELVPGGKLRGYRENTR